MKINGELERIRGLTRYAVLEASIGFFRNNKGLAAATLLAGAFGLAGSLAGCVVSGGVGLGTKLATKKGLLAENEATKRLREVVARDLQPAVNLFLRAYLGAKSPAINVLSLQTKIQAARRKIDRKETAKVRAR